MTMDPKVQHEALLVVMMMMMMSVLDEATLDTTLYV